MMALAVALGFAALFFPPAAALSPTGLLVWVGAALTLSHLAYSGLGILHQAWAARQKVIHRPRYSLWITYVKATRRS